MFKNAKKNFKKKSLLKIFISYHKKFLIHSSKELIPIHIGRAIAKKPTKDGSIKDKEYQWLMENLIGDDTGDNISNQNRKYCELTAQYWVWKNLNQIPNTEYIGFMHYRRHFLFNKLISIKNRVTWLPNSCMYYVNLFQKIIFLLNSQKKSIYESITDYDCLLLKPFNVKNIGYNTIRERFCETIEQNIERYRIFENTMKELYPEYTKEIDSLSNGNKHILCNMFIMKKDLFIEYSQFLFRILSELDKKFDYSISKTPEEMRTLGYLGEFILTIFILIKQKELKINYVDGLIYSEPMKNLYNIYRICKLKLNRII